MIPDNIIEDFREKIKSSQKPLVFFHDDPDGLCAYLQFVKYSQNKVKGIMLKTRPILTKSYKRFIEEYNPDRVFVFDIALFEDELLTQTDIPITWLDHHDILKAKGLDYINPKMYEPVDSLPVSYWIYIICNQHSWLGLVGSLSDGMLAPCEKDFLLKHPTLGIEENEFEEKRLNYVYHSKIGYIYRLINNLLKGSGEDILKNIKLLETIKTPEELLGDQNPISIYLNKENKEIEDQYELLKKQVSNLNFNKSIIPFIYETDGLSFTKEIANELCHKYPNKLVIVGRKKNGLIKMSLRWNKDIRPILKNALLGLGKAWGGGHSYACGACVKEQDFEKFENKLFEQIIAN